MRKISIYVIAILMMVATIGAASAGVVASSLTVGGATTGLNGDDVIVYINVAGATDLAGLQLDLLYNKDVLIINPNKVIEGQFGFDNQMAGKIVIFAAGTPDNTNGKVNIGFGCTDSTAGVPTCVGSGPVAKITFHVVGSAGAVSPLDMSISEIKDMNGNTATITTKTNSQFTVGGVVTKITPTITWSNPADITVGTALSGTQLNAAASDAGAPVAGTFAYTPPTGTVLAVGDSQTLHVVFTPTDTTKYNTASKDVKINVKSTQTNGGTVNGKVFNDLDKDKRLDSGEPGIADVVVKLTGDEKKTKKIKLSTKTDSNGNYIFQNLPDGKYKVHVETKHGWFHTTSTTKRIIIKNGNVVTVNFGKKQNNKHDDNKHN